ncbi:inositol oxygenase family protein [Pedobacter psychroterrae]|uniref:Uncharacterized protein n=1 Tax=Pedobacter psychroterrae TaxID=2530453 RepID=A0A4V2MKN3_9SPHI|nr:inositol oxygenase family protein [Pedobacter psychroterrae]TCC98946.1 hypothetical protein EZ437_17570 [Pedobacter psychroterrae]
MSTNQISFAAENNSPLYNLDEWEYDQKSLEELKPYYQELVAKYLPVTLKF